MPDIFKIALKFTLANEGGYDDDPRDPGGATKKGISLNYYRRYFKPDATKEDIKNLTDQEIEKIYRQEFWFGNNCNLIAPVNAELAVRFFDLGVLFGIGRAKKFLVAAIQKGADPAYIDHGLPQRDVKLYNHYYTEIIDKFKQEAIDYLKTKHPNGSPFMKGWLIRINKRIKELDDV